MEYLHEIIHPVHADHDQLGVADPGYVDDAKNQIEPECQQREHAAEQDAVDHGLQQIDIEDVQKRLHGVPLAYLSRLRGRSDRIERCDPGGGSSLHTGSMTRGDTPTPTLPRKRERGRTFFVEAI